MKKWIITAESGSDINQKDAEELEIYIIPMHVSLGEENLDDGSFFPEKICQYYDETGQLPKTSGCTPNDFIRFFTNIHQKNPEAHILHLAYSGVTTISYNSAYIVSENMNYVTVLDTKHVSGGQRAVVLKTIKFLKQNPEIEQENLVRQVRLFSNNIKMCFIPYDLKYIHSGGRCGNLAFLSGELLKIRPCIEILDGKLIVTKKIRGKFAKVVPKMVQEYTEKQKLDMSEIGFIWSAGLDESIKRIAEETALSCGFGKVYWVKAGCVITTHAGPGAFGIIGTSINQDECI